MRDSDLNREKKLMRFFMNKSYKKQIKSQKESRIAKVTKRKGDKLYVKWKRYDNSFNSCINKKDLV